METTAVGDIVFFHGAGDGAYDIDSEMAADLRSRLGDGYSVVMPQLPEEDDADDRAWLATIEQALADAVPPVVLVGHSAGGYMLLKHLTTSPVTPPVAAICVIAAPFPAGDPDWTFDGFDLPERFGDRLPPGAAVFLYASEDDEIVPFAHRDLYGRAIASAVTRTTTGGHQLGNDLSAVADDIRAIAERGR